MHVLVQSKQSIVLSAAKGIGDATLASELNDYSVPTAITSQSKRLPCLQMETLDFTQHKFIRKTHKSTRANVVV